MDRREFIQKSCFACMALGAGVVSTSLASCSSLPLIRGQFEGNLFPVALSEFEDGRDALLIRSNTLQHDILLIRKSPTSYKALYMQCTHNHFDLSCNKSTIVCTSHGAEFDMDGKVKRGPAKKKLRSFPVSIEKNRVFIHLV